MGMHTFGVPLPLGSSYQTSDPIGEVGYLGTNRSYTDAVVVRHPRMSTWAMVPLYASGYSYLLASVLLVRTKFAGRGERYAIVRWSAWGEHASMNKKRKKIKNENEKGEKQTSTDQQKCAYRPCEVPKLTKRFL